MPHRCCAGCSYIPQSPSARALRYSLRQRTNASVADGWTGPIDLDSIEHHPQLRDIMPVGSGHNERLRDAMTVYHQMVLLPFFPRSVGLGPTLCCASGAFIIALSMPFHGQAMPSNSSYLASPVVHKACLRLCCASSTRGYRALGGNHGRNPCLNQPPSQQGAYCRPA